MSKTSCTVKATSWTMVTNNYFDYSNRFFDEQIAQGVKTREEKDCRKHFFFWLKKISKSSTTNVFKNKLPQQRRGTGVSTGTAADFEQPFNATNHRAIVFNAVSVLEVDISI